MFLKSGELRQKLEKLVAVNFLLNLLILYPRCPILPVTSSMGIGFGQISENGSDPNRSDPPVEEEDKKKKS